MGQPYTHGVWTVNPGQESEFVATWREFAEWTSREVPGNSQAKLLQDKSMPQRFISVGPWRDLEAIDAWRSLPGWQERVQRLRPLLEKFEPSTLEAVVEIEA